MSSKSILPKTKKEWLTDMKQLVPIISLVVLGLFTSVATNSVRFKSDNFFIKHYWLQPVLIVILTWVGLLGTKATTFNKIVITVVFTVLYVLMTAPANQDDEDYEHPTHGKKVKRTTRLL